MIKKTIYGCEERGDALSPYLTRYTLFECSRFQICLHVFHRSDHTDMHDHPWRFVSLLLWRGYIEQTPQGKTRKFPGMILFRNATHQHRVELLQGKKAISLVLMGKRKRDWGFITKSGWIQWEQYFRDHKC